ncbi:unannotated protein [freshwater metagenome]|uniref:Unannotated protein n=1 Tax=freshwater metagenome TaxID=449393 RepID=A0A6J6C0P3_9ZZZZ
MGQLQHRCQLLEPRSVTRFQMVISARHIFDHRLQLCGRHCFRLDSEQHNQRGHQVNRWLYLFLHRPIGHRAELELAFRPVMKCRLNGDLRKQEQLLQQYRLLLLCPMRVDRMPSYFQLRHQSLERRHNSSSCGQRLGE